MSGDRDDLLAALLVERYGRNHWWRTPTTTDPGSVAALTDYSADEADDDLTCARRRREMAADPHAHEHPERKAT